MPGGRCIWVGQREEYTAGRLGWQLDEAGEEDDHVVYRVCIWNCDEEFVLVHLLEARVDLDVWGGTQIS